MEDKALLSPGANPVLLLFAFARCKFFSLTETPEDYTIIVDEEGFLGKWQHVPLWYPAWGWTRQTCHLTEIVNENVCKTSLLSVLAVQLWKVLWSFKHTVSAVQGNSDMEYEYIWMLGEDHTQVLKSSLSRFEKAKPSAYDCIKMSWPVSPRLHKDTYHILHFQLLPTSTFERSTWTWIVCTTSAATTVLWSCDLAPLAHHHELWFIPLSDSQLSLHLVCHLCLGWLTGSKVELVVCHRKWLACAWELHVLGIVQELV